MSTITTGEIRSQLSDVINRAAYKGERIVVTRHGKGLVAVVPIEDLELLERLDDRLDEQAIEEALAEQGNEPPIPWETAKRMLGKESKVAPKPRKVKV